MDGFKLAINLEMPKEPEYKPSMLEIVEDCMARVEFDNDHNAYKKLRQINNCAAKCHRAGKRSDKLHALLGLLSPFMAKHGLQDPKGVDIIDEYVTNPDYLDREDMKDE